MWIRISDAMAKTTLHPHGYKPHVYVTIVAIDRRKVELHLVAGTVEPKSKAVPPEHRTGLVPEADQPRLLAVFNGGFMTRHGGFGMKIGQDTFLEPLPDSCSILLLPENAVAIGTHSTLKSIDSAVAYRQTPPCLVEGGTTNPDLESDYLIRKWGAAEGGDKDIRRSALGVDASGFILFYGSGEWVNAKAIALAMRAAGSAAAAELDINYSYTKFLFYARGADDKLAVSEALIPKTKYSPRGYVEKASDRDFFYLTKKP